MAYIAGDLFAQTNGPPGKLQYRYDTLDELNVVETAGYFNNLDDNLNLQKGDSIFVWSWTTTIATGTLNRVMIMAVTNVIANDAAAAAGNVNVAEIIGVLEAGGISSGV